MAAPIARKNYRLDTRKLARARRALGTRTETETIHRALELAASAGAFRRATREFIREARRGRIDDPHAR
jgi:hypothetical protein